jgi:hypothetical protein
MLNKWKKNLCSALAAEAKFCIHTSGNIIVIYVLLFRFLSSISVDKRIWTEG